MLCVREGGHKRGCVVSVCIPHSLPPPATSTGAKVHGPSPSTLSLKVYW